MKPVQTIIEALLKKDAERVKELKPAHAFLGKDENFGEWASTNVEEFFHMGYRLALHDVLNELARNETHRTATE